MLGGQNLSFKSAYEQFLELHLAKSTGEKLRRLREGHGHAEKLFLENVWWPALRHFNDLHPEYEVYDFKDGNRYLDFAYLHSDIRLAIEIDGFGPHWKNISRWQFSDHCQRQNHLVLDGWQILRFTYDDVREKPRVCQQTLQQFMGRWLGEEKPVEVATVLEKEIVRLAFRMCRPITPRDVSEHLKIGTEYSQRLLHSLVEKKWLQPASGKIRVRSYKTILEGKNIIL